ncbi:MAG: hypothetical protein U1E76_27840 [Planctomycetota bacterium]
MLVLVLMGAAFLLLEHARRVRLPRPAALAVSLLPLLAAARIDSVLDHPERLPKEAEALPLLVEEFADPALGQWQRFLEPRRTATAFSFARVVAADGQPELECGHHGESLCTGSLRSAGHHGAAQGARGPAPVFAAEYKNPQVSESLERLQKARPVNQIALEDGAAAPGDGVPRGQQDLAVVEQDALARDRHRRQGRVQRSRRHLAQRGAVPRVRTRVPRAHARIVADAGRGAARSAWAQAHRPAGRRANALFVPPPTRIDLSLEPGLRGKLLRPASRSPSARRRRTRARRCR